MCKKELGQKIKDLRTALGLSQTDFGHKLDVSFMTVHRWETGKSKPHKSFLNKMKRFKVPEGGDRD